MRNESLERFKNLLKELFQFSASDLDFGIYRILNAKRAQINDFIENKLGEKVESAFAKYKKERLEDIERELNEIKRRIIENLGENALTPSGELKEEFNNTPLGRQYLEIKERRGEVESIEAIQNQVFNDLYNFFSRYYEEGDFIPQYRYSIKSHKYAIPYNGEEVKLYWANSDQYYIKTGYLFRDYTFTAGGFRVIFRVVSAREEISGNKATTERFFLLDDAEPVEIEDKSIIIRLQYRELFEEEVKKFGVEGGSNTSKQEKINEIIFENLKRHLPDSVLGALLTPRDEKPLLLYHISRFTAKNTRDYFIHKDLRRFLSEQLDYFIKAEVLDIETLEKERFLDKHLTRAKVVREIGEEIIDFLAQLEDFQKRLWEKKKFVLRTDYVITLDKIKEYGGEEFLEEIGDEILRNEEQLREWKELLGVEVKGKEDLIERATLEGREWRKLPLDTRYFGEEFKLRLLEVLTRDRDLDDILDGLLIKSENWQALNLLLNKFKEKVQTIYIDPPFNKEQDADYLYNVKFKDSTWISMLENRLRLARELLSERGSIFVRCDYNGNMFVRLLMNEIFGKENFVNEITVGKTPGKKKTGLSLSYTKDYLLFYGKSIKNFIMEISKPTEDYQFFQHLAGILTKSLSADRLSMLKKIVEENIFWVDLDHRPGERKDEKSRSRTVFGVKFEPPRGRHWIKSQEKLDELQKAGKCRIKCKNCGKIFYSERELKDCCENKKWVIQIYLDEEIVGDDWTDISGYSQAHDFPTENSEILLKRVIESTSNEGDLVMDFFLGSGTTCAVAHKLKRKWIGVEMGEHFWTVVMPRMKKVLFYDKSGISKEKDVKEKYNEKNAGGFFKYQILEQYEDALDNIELKENREAMELFKDEYLLKYFLDFETRENPYLLNIDLLKNPFKYKLKVNLKEVGEPEEMIIDIPETFNYLLGLKVKKIKYRKNDYLFILGEKEGKSYTMVWRDWSEKWSDEEYIKDREFIKQELKEWKPQVVYINGQNILTPNFGDFQIELRCTETEFKKLMER